MTAEIGPPIDDGRDPSDGGDPARCAGGLVHLKHLGGGRERASSKADPTIWVATSGKVHFLGLSALQGSGLNYCGYATE